MKSAPAFFLVLILVGFVAWFIVSTSETGPSGITEAEIAQIEAGVREEVTSLADSLKDAFLGGDPESFMSVYTSDVRIYWFGMDFTRDEFHDWAVEAFQNTTFTGVEFKLIELFVHGDRAYAIFEWSDTFQAGGQEPETVIWNCFTRLENEDGVWKFDRDVCGPRDAPSEG